MKKVLVVFAMVVLPMVSSAQYYNPYNYYQQQQAMQDAYNMGRAAAERDRQETLRNPSKVLSLIVENLGKGYVFPDAYEKAYEYADHLASVLDDARGYLFLGYMNEMGIGTSRSRKFAKECYSDGADLGNKQCKRELRRCNEGNYYSTSDAENFKLYYSRVVTSAYSAAQALNWNSGSTNRSDSGNSNSSGRRGTCSSCNGTGVNPQPNSGGSLAMWVAHYNKPGISCRYCGRTTGHFHDRCASCNVPTY